MLILLGLDHACLCLPCSITRCLTRLVVGLVSAKIPLSMPGAGDWHLREQRLSRLPQHCAVMVLQAFDGWPCLRKECAQTSLSMPRAGYSDAWCWTMWRRLLEASCLSLLPIPGLWDKISSPEPSALTRVGHESVCKQCWSFTLLLPIFWDAWVAQTCVFFTGNERSLCSIASLLLISSCSNIVLLQPNAVWHHQQNRQRSGIFVSHISTYITHRIHGAAIYGNICHPLYPQC